MTFDNFFGIWYTTTIQVTYTLLLAKFILCACVFYFLFFRMQFAFSYSVVMLIEFYFERIRSRRQQRNIRHDLMPTSNKLNTILSKVELK